MTVLGTDYLLRISALSVSFVGFAGVIVALRRALGSELTPIHWYLVRFFIEGGLAVTTLGLLPSAVTFLALPESTVWRLASGVAALLFSGYLVVLFRRRQRVSPRIRAIHLEPIVTVPVSLLALVGFWANTIGVGFQPGSVLYVLPLTAFLLLGFWVFIQNLDRFFG